jgi:hypothetical protein
MAFVTYILMIGTIMGMEDRFKPDVLTMTASTALFFMIVQVMFLRLGMYLLNINLQEPPLYLTDLIAYCGYQFVRYVCIFVMMMQLLSL